MENTHTAQNAVLGTIIVVEGNRCRRNNKNEEKSLKRTFMHANDIGPSVCVCNVIMYIQAIRQFTIE